MTDEQILKQMAEIEGWSAGKVIDVANYDRDIYGYFDHGHRVDPLTNWSDLGPLLEKYVQTIEKHPDSPFVQEYWRGKYTVLTLDDAGVATNESLPHAICLAIIEACKDQV